MARNSSKFSAFGVVMVFQSWFAILVGFVEPLMTLAHYYHWINYAWLFGQLSWLCILFGFFALLLPVVVILIVPKKNLSLLVAVPFVWWILLEDLTVQVLLGGNQWSYMGLPPLYGLPVWYSLVVVFILGVLVMNSEAFS